MGLIFNLIPQGSQGRGDLLTVLSKEIRKCLYTLPKRQGRKAQNYQEGAFTCVRSNLQLVGVPAPCEQRPLPFVCACLRGRAHPPTTPRPPTGSATGCPGQGYGLSPPARASRICAWCCRRRRGRTIPAKVEGRGQAGTPRSIGGGLTREVWEEKAEAGLGRGRIRGKGNERFGEVAHRQPRRSGSAFPSQAADSGGEVWEAPAFPPTHPSSFISSSPAAGWTRPEGRKGGPEARSPEGGGSRGASPSRRSLPSRRGERGKTAGCAPDPELQGFLRVDQDKDRECSLDCAGSPQKSLCASDGRTFLSRCEFQRAKCKDPQLEIAYRGNCKDVSRCVAERKYTQEQARKEFQQVFIPECNDDGTYSQVQCHSYTGYCWCVTPNGRPISGTAVAHKTPRCPGSVSEKLPQREGAGKADDASAPALETQPQGDEEDIASRYPTLWTEQVKSRQNKTNKSSASSCDQELQSALEEAKQPQKDNVFIPECAQGGLYKPVQCHPSTGYCWCVLVDTGRPIPGTSTRYEQPKCDNSARAHQTKTKDLYKGRQLQGCPGAKKNEFLTSVLDALSTDMVHAVSDPSLSSSRVSEPDPNHTLEERVVHWYFKQLDKNSSGDIGKKEIKPFKRFLRKKSKPKKCVKKFVEYCDVNNDKSLSVQELMGCLGVTKEEAPKTNTESTSSSRQQVSKKQG
ncbi:SPARC-related modular calcium-binding protein 2 [Meleagris gallopavo]|uniref:SPARC-related modular calcium-binding protein 2 n=1 Tax=Meleagris gallopavo TaxID=9103 RepID=UPI0012AB905C|nr:SPARC-related modular calcium-binding protein 2 [Meleagris gallopavo]